MLKDTAKVWKDVNAQQLAAALVCIDNQKSMQNFLRDVMTKKEIIEIGARLEAARMLKNGARYTDITNKTNLSSRTVARISDWLQNGTNGYDVALKSMPSHSDHTQPVRAD